MKNSAIVKILAATMLAVALVPASSAQESTANEDIEVITIVGKRLVPSMASTCMNEVMTQTPAATLRNEGDFQPDAAVARLINNIGVRQALRNCVHQAVAISHARI
jgi:predicted Zn-dependent protease